MKQGHPLDLRFDFEVMWACFDDVPAWQRGVSTLAPSCGDIDIYFN